MILCAHSNEDHSSPCTIYNSLNSSCFSGNETGRESTLFFGNKWKLDYSLIFSKVGNGNGNEVMRMGGNGTRTSFHHISNFELPWVVLSDLATYSITRRIRAASLRRLSFLFAISLHCFSLCLLRSIAAMLASTMTFTRQRSVDCVLLQWMFLYGEYIKRGQGRQSVVKIGGAQTRRGLGAKPPEAKGYYRIKFAFLVQLHRCVLKKNCVLCVCDKFAVSPEKYQLKDKSVFSVFYHS